MRRLSTLIILLSVACMMAMAQIEISPRAQVMIKNSKTARSSQTQRAKSANSAEQRLTFVVKVAENNGAQTFAKMKELGAVVQAKIGRQAVISIPASSVDELCRIEGIQRIAEGQKGKKKTDVTLVETGVNLINGSTEDTQTAYTGKGVTIAILDEGFDFQHIAFKDAEGNNRIKCVYVLGDTDGAGKKMSIEDPEAGTIEFPGLVYDTPELIATLTTDKEDEVHGTHTAGIAAGARSPLGFQGMAPDADLVLVAFGKVATAKKGDDNLDVDDYMVTGMAFINEYAVRNNKKLVFSFSANQHDGPHDGTGPVPEAVAELSQNAIPIISSSNEGDERIYLYHKFSTEQPSFKVSFDKSVKSDFSGFDDWDLSGIASTTAGYEYGEYGDEGDEGDENDEDIMEESLLMVTRSTDKNANLTLKATIFQFDKETYSIIGDVYEIGEWNFQSLISDGPALLSSEDNAELAQYFTGQLGCAALYSSTGKLGMGLQSYGYTEPGYCIKLEISGTEGSVIDSWFEGSGFNSTYEGFAFGSAEKSAGEWSSTPSCISVGAYCANNVERKTNGEEEEDPQFSVGKYADFSSYGTMLNGVTQPTVSAPGVHVVSSLNTYAIDPEDRSDKMAWDGCYYGAESGTSMSCPVVSGIVALWLQANPDLTLSDIKEVMRETSVNDSFTAEDPIRWGYGKINAAKGLEYITHMTGINEISTSNAKVNGIIYDLSGRRLNGKPQRGMYIMDGRKYVVK